MRLRERAAGRWCVSQEEKVEAAPVCSKKWGGRVARNP
eukprot:COSAG01_NODE_3476_length_6033_cov_3.090327_3_plen_38_part_00